MMGDLSSKLLEFVYKIVLPIIVGYAAKKITKIPKEKFDILIKINLAVFLPVAIALTFWNMQVSRDLIFLPLIGLFVPVVGAVFGYLLSKKRYETDNERGSFIVSSMLSNRLTIGGLSAYIVFGEKGYVYVNLILLFQAINNYVIGHTLGNYYGNKHKIKNGPTFEALVLRITNISILGILVGLALKFTGIPRPEAVAAIVDKLITVVAWMALLAIGAAIEFRNAMKYIKDVPRMFLIKFVILPAVSAGLAFLLLTDPIAIASVIILGITPVAINSVIVAKMNNLNQAATINAFLTTTLFYIAIIFPLIAFVVQMVFS